MADTVTMEIFQKYAATSCGDRFNQVTTESRYDIERMATIFIAVGKSLGKTVETIEYPMHWNRLLARKDCPKYMKVMEQACVRAYYPRIPIPDEPHYLTIDTKQKLEV